MNENSQRVPNLSIGPRLGLRGTRLQEPMHDLCASLDAIQLATRAVWGLPQNVEATGHSAYTGTHFRSVVIRLPALEAFRAAAKNQPARPIWIQLIPIKDASVPKAATTGSVAGINHLFDRLGAVHFLLYYEAYIDWVKSKAKGEKRDYHPVWNFARVVRNSIGHGGTVNIHDSKTTPVSWHGLTYGPMENGTRIIGGPMGLPDLIILILEMDQALSTLGHPGAAPVIIE